MKQSELDKIIKDHQKWLNDEGGQRANLYSANLSNIDLSDTNLHGAGLSNSNLHGAGLSNSNLSRADLSRADLSSADLSSADLSGAGLSSANLCRAKGIIRIGPSLDGYEFFGVVRDGVTWIKAGCRWFTVSDARKHWRENRGDTDLGKERLEFCAFIARWGRRNGAKT